ncbi:hypothetical protein [Fluviispira multicolorata]|uniref:Type II secretion system protein GspE N-terminal domain-containing protein n=1 Tax=Fluviispira multicolorata TaxID=2654512 RepID=A0A833JE18_9BACT|nr:hypothetical protein [Fluviispira multicolorata]KAB8032145.1 hypothetical protein GCL57_05725 [Fluviispira multicolorata]
MYDLLQIMQQDGYLSSIELLALRKTCKDLGENPVRMLRSLNIASPEQIQDYLQRYFGVGALGKQALAMLDETYQSLVPIDLAIHFSCFGLGEDANALYIALEDPSDRGIINQLRFFLNKRIIGVSATVFQLAEGLSKIYKVHKSALNLTTILENTRGVIGGIRYEVPHKAEAISIDDDFVSSNLKDSESGDDEVVVTKKREKGRDKKTEKAMSTEPSAEISVAEDTDASEKMPTVGFIDGSSGEVDQATLSQNEESGVENEKVEAVQQDPVTEESQELSESTPVAEESQELSESTPVAEEPQELSESTPVAEESQELSESTPVAEESQELSESTPVAEEPQELSESTPVAEESQELSESIPVAEESQELSESTPVAEESQELSESIPVAEESQELSESTPVAEEPQELDMQAAENILTDDSEMEVDISPSEEKVFEAPTESMTVQLSSLASLALVKLSLLDDKNQAIEMINSLLKPFNTSVTLREDEKYLIEGDDFSVEGDLSSVVRPEENSVAFAIEPIIKRVIKMKDAS